jgi:alkylated DNA repair dioxygenase AlkB
MDMLFPVTVSAADVPEIPGLRYRPDYLSAAQEHDLAGEIDRLPWDTTWKRRRQPYGASYGSGTAPPLPAWGRRLADRLLAEGITPVPFDQLLVNEYLPGQGIAMHRDYAPFGATVVSLSLLSPCVMDFRRVRDGHKERLLLERRSLLILSDTARYDWEHGIAPRKKDAWHGVTLERARRLSVTFRYRVEGTRP